MSVTLMTFDKNWTNIADFPTHESQESKVRADMQYLFDSIKNQFNNFVSNELVAANIPYVASGGLQAENIQTAIDAMQEEVNSISQGSVADGAITTIKLDQTSGAEAVTTATIRNLAITNDKLAASAVTTGKLATGAVTDTKLATGSVTHEKVANGAVGTDNIIDLAITGAKIGNGEVTYAKTSGIQAVHSTTTVSLPILASNVHTWTVSATGVTANNTVVVNPNPTYFADWVDNRVRCTGQGAGTLSFACDTNPTRAITVNVLILNK